MGHHHQHIGDPMFWVILLALAIITLFAVTLITPRKGMSPISIPWFGKKEK